MEHPKSKATQPSPRGDGPPCNIQPQFTLLDGINTVSEGPWFGASLLFPRGVARGLREDLLFAQFLEANK